MTSYRSSNKLSEKGQEKNPDCFLPHCTFHLPNSPNILRGAVVKINKKISDTSLFPNWTLYSSFYGCWRYPHLTIDRRNPFDNLHSANEQNKKNHEK